jgi:hypothetical protein
VPLLDVRIPSEPSLLNVGEDRVDHPAKGGVVGRVEIAEHAKPEVGLEQLPLEQRSLLALHHILAQPAVTP